MKVNIGPLPNDDSERVVEIEIHDYDTWNCDHTLSLIAVPLLKRFREKTASAPYTDDADAPEELRDDGTMNVAAGELDKNHFKRWHWILDEIIWALEHIADDDWESEFFGENVQFDREKYNATHARIQNGCRLFGKYFQNLWD